MKSNTRKRIRTGARCALFALGCIVIFSGCSLVQKQVMKVKSKPQIVLEEAGAVVSLAFLDEATLLDRFGPVRYNPFMTVYYSLDFRRIVVFELRIINKTGANLEISTRESFLIYEGGGVRIPAYNQFLLEDYWEKQFSGNVIKEEDFYEMQKKIRNYSSNTFETINDGATLKCILPFVGSAPHFGKTTVSIGVMEKATGKLLKRLEFPFEFE